VAKGPEAFRTISEAADELHVPQHVLRFWETRFAFIRPMKRAGGRRFYRPADIAVLRGVRHLLHDEGYTIKGVQRLHREQGVRRLVAAGESGGASQTPAAYAEPPSGISGGDNEGLLRALGDLEAAKRRLDALLK
jgi:DNA-binding transcriptional MerR regulator